MTQTDTPIAAGWTYTLSDLRRMRVDQLNTIRQMERCPFAIREAARLEVQSRRAR